MSNNKKKTIIALSGILFIMLFCSYFTKKGAKIGRYLENLTTSGENYAFFHLHAFVLFLLLVIFFIIKTDNKINTIEKIIYTLFVILSFLLIVAIEFFFIAGGEFGRLNPS